MLNRFMYASIGVLGLVLAFHFGASSARSSPVDCIDHAHFLLQETGFIAVVTNGELQLWRETGLYQRRSLPRQGGIADVYHDVNDDFYVLYRDGELYRWRPGGWQLLLNTSCGSTSVATTTWGEVKLRGAR